LGWQNSNLIIGTFNEVMTTPGISKPKTCYYAFGGASATLASPTECTTGTCVEVVDTCGTGSPPIWNSVAAYTNMTFANGTFANSSFVRCDCIAYDVTAGTTRKCHPYNNTTDGFTWATDSSGGMKLSVLSTDQGSTSSTSYISLKCEGTAP